MEKELPIIKHIVLSGGGQSIFTFYGVIKKANETGLWNISNIESIYGTSAGAILSLFIALKCDWKQIDDYLIKRPWDKVFNINLDSVVSIMNKFGFFEINVIHEIFKPDGGGASGPSIVRLRLTWADGQFSETQPETCILKTEVIQI